MDTGTSGLKDIVKLFHDIPLKRSRIVSTVDILVKSALFQGRGIHHLEGTHYKRIFWRLQLFAD